MAPIRVVPLTVEFDTTLQHFQHACDTLINIQLALTTSHLCADVAEWCW